MRLRLLWNVFSVEARKRMSYRADFWINSILGLLVTFSFYWFLTYALFASGSPTLAGYSPEGMILYYAFVTLFGRLVQSVNLDLSVAQDIYEGRLNRYLLYPAPYAAMKYAETWGGLTPHMLQLVLLGGVAPSIVGIPGELHITLGSMLMAGVSLFVANALYFLLAWPIQTTAFWADNVWSLSVAMRISTGMLGGHLLPLGLFPQWAQDILAWLPFPYLFSVPVRTLLGTVGFVEWLSGLAIAILWCGVIGLIGGLIWRRGDLQYSGVGI